MELIGFIVLVRPPMGHTLHREDAELLETVAAHVAGHLVEEQRTQTLEEGRRFAELSRGMAFIAHDLRSPFNVILGFSELLESSAGSFDADTIARYSAMVNSAGNTAYGLLENLLDWSRMQMGHGDFTPEQIDTAEILRRNVKMLLPEIILSQAMKSET